VPLHLPIITSDYIPVNTPVEDGQELTILGERMQFFTEFGSDDKVHTTVWLPERKLVLNTFLWSSPPQLYSLRGDQFRDPAEWVSGLKLVRDLEAEVLVTGAAKPVVGKETIAKTLNGYIDGTNFILDQTLRGITKGQGPDELRHTVVFPDYLREIPNNQENYGEISSYTPAIFLHAVGWYDNDAGNIKPLAPIDEANRMIVALGGYDQVIALSEKAFDANEFAWSVQLVNYLYVQNPMDEKVRLLKAKVLRQMAYVSTGASDRAHILSQARSLEGKTHMVRNFYPEAPAFVAAPTTFVDYFRIRLDHKLNADNTQMIRFDFDNGQSAGLHVRRAVAEFVESPESYKIPADIVLSLSGETWAKLYLSEATFEDLVKTGEIKVEGNLKDAIKTFNAFDKIVAHENLVIPPMPAK